MTLPADTPKLPKWPFLVGDATLLILAWLIADQSRNPFAGTPLIAIVSCVALGAVCGAIPFLADYARKQDEALDERQRGLDSLARIVSASAEQISIAANGLNQITEVSHRNLKAAEQLPQKLQEKIASFKAQLDSASADDREELEKEVATLRAGESERLESAADKMAKSVAELTKLEASAQKHLAGSTEALTKATAALAALQAKIAAASSDAAAEPAAPRVPRKPRAEESAPEVPARSPNGESPPADSSPNPQSAIPAPQSPAEPAPIPIAAIPEIVAVAPSDSSAPVEEPKPARKRAPRKPKSDGSAETALPFTPEESAPASPPSDAPNPQSDSEPPPSSSSTADGVTRLFVTAYIGIGNRLFIRGAGPGLSWDKGVPLQFVSIGKWRWESPEAKAPVEFKLFKNDDVECAALGSMTLAVGQQQEVTATF